MDWSHSHFFLSLCFARERLLLFRLGMQPSLFYSATIPVSRPAHEPPQRMEDKRRAVEELFFKYLTQNQELKRRFTVATKEHQQTLQREQDLLNQLRTVEEARLDAENREQQRVVELRGALTEAYKQMEALTRDNGAMREQLRSLELTVLDLKADNEALRAAARQALSSHRRYDAEDRTSPAAAARRSHDPLATTRLPSPPHAQEHVDVDPFSIVVATGQVAEAVVYDEERHATHPPVSSPPTANYRGGMDGGGDVESVSPIMRPREVDPPPAPLGSPNNWRTDLGPPVEQVSVAADETLNIASQPSIRVPPPPTRGTGSSRRPPAATPRVPNRASSHNNLPQQQASLDVSSSAVQQESSSFGQVVPEPSLATEGSLSSRSAPLVASAPAGLRKFNFSKVSKLELVGNASSQAYLTLVERRYTIHMVSKLNPSSKVPSLPPALAREGRSALPAHPIKMFGQHWYVFEVADNKSDLPSSVTTGSMETLLMQLVYRIQAQQYMKLSDILSLFLGVAMALQSFHRIGFAHGNVDSCNIFCPRIAPSSDEHASPPPGQSLVLSAFAVTPFHRNPLFRAPETRLAPDDASIASDLWALGVVFWDITNYGLAPLYDVVRDADSAKDDAQAAFEMVCRGEARLGCPENCPPAIFHDLVEPLLHVDPLQRPSVETIIATIEGFLNS